MNSNNPLVGHMIPFYDSMKQGTLKGQRSRAKHFNMSGRQFKKLKRAIHKNQKAKNDTSNS